MADGQVVGLVSPDGLRKFLRTEEGKQWLSSVLQRHRELRGTVGEKMVGFGDAAVDKIVAAVRDPLTLDAAKAEWIANQLLEAGEHGILLPVNVVLDAYVRGKSRYYLRKHAVRSTAAVAAACAAVHLVKLGLKRATRDVKYVGPAVAFAMDVALPTSVLGPLLMARLML
ncbi:hypothetical protein WJX75_001251 [Coccomyxa subellipsoidea]|uniref:Uncharacterized protein n=1 Tax=Coccomyxa subellipsoidea TaxID=248742 RepID=A0ABR2YG89_9CHLO